MADRDFFERLHQLLALFASLAVPFLGTRRYEVALGRWLDANFDGAFLSIPVEGLVKVL